MAEFEERDSRWQQCLDENSAAMMANLNPTDELLFHLKAARLFTEEEYQSIIKHAAVNTRLRSMEFIGILGKGSDRFSTTEKLKLMIKAFKDKNFPRPSLADIFQKYLDENYPESEAEGVVTAGNNFAETRASEAIRIDGDARLGVLMLGGGQIRGPVINNQGTYNYNYG